MVDFLIPKRIEIVHRQTGPTAYDKLKEDYLTMDEFCSFFGMEEKRVKDLISLHKRDNNFMPAYKISAGKYLFNKDDVLRYITARATVNQETFEFSQPEGEK